MPKIVDHDRYRAELAEKAVAVFRRHGFHGLGMRQIAEALGVSKSALYHYFPSKQALFEACSEVALALPPLSVATDASEAERFQLLEAIGMGLAEEFQGELTLLLDYVRPLSAAKRRKDPAMRRALSMFTDALAQIVGPAQANDALCHLLGILLLRTLDGQTPDFSPLRRYCTPRAD